MFAAVRLITRISARGNSFLLRGSALVKRKVIVRGGRFIADVTSTSQLILRSLACVSTRFRCLSLPMDSTRGQFALPWFPTAGAQEYASVAQARRTVSRRSWGRLTGGVCPRSCGRSLPEKGSGNFPWNGGSCPLDYTRDDPMARSPRLRTPLHGVRHHVSSVQSYIRQIEIVSRKIYPVGPRIVTRRLFFVVWFADRSWIFKRYPMVLLIYISS